MTEGPHAPHRVLLVEDQPLIAMDVEAMLGVHGFDNLEIATSVAEALELIVASPPDLALLDLNLGSETSLPIAEELISRSIPFVFATGYGDRSMIPAKLDRIPIVQKPFDAHRLAEALRHALHGQGGPNDPSDR